MNIKKGDYVQLLDGAIFNINYVHDIDAGETYPFEGRCIICTDNDIWRLGEYASWSYDGNFQIDDEMEGDDRADNIDIHKVLTKEKNPEYFL